MNKDKIYISTTASDAAEVARRWGLGIEIAEFCTAWNMDDKFAETDAQVRKNWRVFPAVYFTHLLMSCFPVRLTEKPDYWLRSVTGRQ